MPEVSGQRWVVDTGVMRVLFAPDRFAGLLTAGQTAAAMAEGWARGAPHDDLTALPLGDGGPGLIDVLAGGLAHVGAEDLDQVVTTTSDPLGRTVPATLLRVHLPNGGPTAFIDAAEATGGHLVPAREINAGATTSAGIATLIRQTLDLDVRRIVVGMGPGVAFDGGAGLLAGLGVTASGAPLDQGGLALADVTAIDGESLDAARALLADVELDLVTDEDLPLLGFHGVHAIRSADAGVATETGQALESAVGHFANLLGRAERGNRGGDRRDLLTGKPIRPGQQPGAGAGGGAGHAVLALGGRRLPGAATVAALVGLSDALERHDLVVTGNAHFDWESLRSGVIPHVAAGALSGATPAVVVAGECLVGRREAMSLGLSGTYALAELPTEREQLLTDPVRVLEERMARLARTWSPGR